MSRAIYSCTLLKDKPNLIFAGTHPSLVGQPLDYELDIDSGYTMRAALVSAIIRSGGYESEIQQYRLRVYDRNTGELLRDFAASPDGIDSQSFPTLLEDVSDEQLVDELLRRLRNR